MRDPDSVIADAVPFTLRIPPVIHAELKAMCEGSGKSLNSTINAAIRKMLDDAAQKPARRRHMPRRDEAAPRGARPWASRSAPSGGNAS